MRSHVDIRISTDAYNGLLNLIRMYREGYIDRNREEAAHYLVNQLKDNVKVLSD